MSGYGGGGFMAGGSQGGGGGGSPGQRKQSNHTYRPVTIKDLLEAYQAGADSEFRINDVELDHITFVGVISNYAAGDTNVSMTVEDGTGEISVRMWLETAADDTGKAAQLDQGKYVRVIGTMKSFNNKRSVNATVCNLVTDFNEVQYHLLEVMYVHLYHTRGPPNQNGNGPAAMQGVQKQNYNQGNGQRSAGMDAYSMNANAGNNNGGTDYSGLKPNARKIMQYIERIGVDNLPEEGLNLDALSRAIGVSLDNVRNEVQNLVEDGSLYTTADDDHILPTMI